MAVKSPVMIPESPLMVSAFPSPDLRQAGPSTRSRIVSYGPPPLPLSLSDPSPSSILSLLRATDYTQSEVNIKGKGNNVRAALILRHAMKWAVDHADLELLSWLTNLGDPWSVLLDEEVQSLEEEDGWGLVGMALQSSCGRQEREEAARLIVGRWGTHVGPRDGNDRCGWTPMHLAALVSTPPLVSFLLTRGASPLALTSRGLTPYDLISDMPDRQDIAVLLDHSTTYDAHLTSEPSLSARRQAMLAKRREKAVERMRRRDEEQRQKKQNRAEEDWIRNLARIIDVSPELLLAGKRKHQHLGNTVSEGVISFDTDDESEPLEDEGIGVEDPDIDLTSLVFSLIDLDRSFDIIITSYRPVCQPVTERTLPANVLFLYARFAHYRCDEDWLEELIEGAVERIEQGIYGHMEDAAYLAFWAYNTTVLLYLLRDDTGIREACEELNLLSMLEELINAIHVFIIRTAERRIDLLLDAALLDHETLEDFDDVKFEGEWNFFKSITGKKRQPGAKASQVFGSGSINGTPTTKTAPDCGPPSSPSLFGSLRNSVAAGSPFRPVHSQSSISDEDSSTMRSVSVDSTATITASTPMLSAEPAETSPASITEILSAILLILQLYEVNPALVVQAFSQIFFWISSELFNRILTRKKYLCRSKAVQIKMNITALEDWVRSNGLPSKTATKHLEPVSQLLQWLQCSSQIRQFDTLIGTMQNMKAINPLQMRKAVRDYRFEVNEGKMTDECVQYLAQVQKDWEKRRLQLKVEAVQDGGRKPKASESSDGSTEDDWTFIDTIFDGNTSLSDFIPQTSPESLGELLDSRYMLPFQLPRNNEYLVAKPSERGRAHGYARSSFSSDSGRSSRPGSVSSIQSIRSLSAIQSVDWTLPHSQQLRQLPKGFFRWLKDQQTEHRRRQDPRPSRKVNAGDSHPLESGQKPNTPNKTPMPKTDPFDENENTPVLSASTSYPAQPFSIAELPLRSSQSMEALRQKAKTGFAVAPSLTHKRSESFELKLRSAEDGRKTDGVPRSAPLPEKANLNTGGPYPTPWEAGPNSPLSGSTPSKRWWQSSTTSHGRTSVNED